MTTSYTTLTVEEIGRVRRITLNRPDHHNPLTPRSVREILGAVSDAENDIGASVVIIRSTGRSFSSGYGFIAEDTDPGDFPPHTALESDVSAMLRLSKGWSRIWECALPVIAQVQGNCLAEEPTLLFTVTSSSPQMTRALASRRFAPWAYLPRTCGCTTSARSGRSDSSSQVTPSQGRKPANLDSSWRRWQLSSSTPSSSSSRSGWR